MSNYLTSPAFPSDPPLKSAFSNFVQYTFARDLPGFLAWQTAAIADGTSDQENFALNFLENQWTDWLVAVQLDVPVHQISRQNEYAGLCITDGSGGFCTQVDQDDTVGSKNIARRIGRSELTRLDTVPYSGIAIGEAKLVSEAIFNPEPEQDTSYYNDCFFVPCWQSKLIENDTMVRVQAWTWLPKGASDGFAQFEPNSTAKLTLYTKSDVAEYEKTLVQGVNVMRNWAG